MKLGTKVTRKRDGVAATLVKWVGHWVTLKVHAPVTHLVTVPAGSLRWAYTA